MSPLKLIASAALPVLCIALAAGCSTTEAPPAPPPPAAPIVYSAPPAPTQPDQEWNLFPDPTTGRVDVYHKGKYVGAVTGNEPADQDPPLPHPVDEQ
jgi:hypothetical protein